MTKLNKTYSASNVLLYSLILSIFILGKDAFGGAITTVAILLSLLGFVVSTANANGDKDKAINILIDIANMSVSVWIIFAVFQSSLLFEKIILALAEGILFITAMLSFNPSYKRNRAYIQTLTSILFITYPLLQKTDTSFYQVLSIIYILLWIAIFRLSIQESYGVNYRGISIIMVFCFTIMMISLPLAYALKKRIYFPKIKQFSAFLKTKKLNIENNLYQLQNKLYKESVKLTAKHNPNAHGNEIGIDIVNARAQGRIINLLSSLFQESLYTLPVDKARTGLKDMLHRPGFGFEKGNKKSLFSLVKDYVDTKIKVNNARKTNKLSNEIENNIKSLRIKVSALLKVNKINRSNNVKQINKTSRALNKLADSLSDTGKKNDLKKAAEALRRWKLYSIYNAARDKIENILKSMNEKTNNRRLQDKKHISNLLNSIEKAMIPKDISQLYPAAENIGMVLNNMKSETVKDIKNSFKKMIESKTELSLAESLDNLVNNLSNKMVPENTIDEISRRMKEIIKSERGDELSKKTKMLKDTLQETNTSDYVLKDINTQNIISGKSESLKNKEETEINKLLDKSILSKKQKKQMISAANTLFYSDNSAVNEWNKLTNKIEYLSSSGRMYKNTYKELKGHLDELRIISEVRNKYREQIKESNKESNTENKGIWKEFMEKIKNMNTRNELNSMMNELKSAKHIQEITIAENSLYKNIDKLNKNGSLKFQVDEFEEQEKSAKELVNAILKDSRGKQQEFVAPEKAVDWLNNSILPYKLLNGIKLTKEIQELLTQIEQSKDKKLSNLTEEELKALVKTEEGIRLKRLILEQKYPLKTPKSHKNEISAMKNNKREETRDTKSTARRKNMINEVKDYVKMMSKMREKALRSKELVQLMNNLSNLGNVPQDYQKRISYLLKKLQEIYIKGEKVDENLIKKLKNTYLDLSAALPDKTESNASTKKWQILAFPDDILMNNESTSRVRVMGVYNKRAIKNITQEVKWKFDNPNVVWIDKHGIIHAISRGTTKAFTKYKESTPLYIDITVVKPIDPNEKR